MPGRPYYSKEHADEILEDFDSAARSLNLKPFLLAGTCLGMVRDGGYIENDNDMDLGVISNHKIKCCRERDYVNLSMKLIEKGFRYTVYARGLNVEDAKKSFNTRFRKAPFNEQRGGQWWRYGIIIDIVFRFNDPRHIVLPFIDSFDEVTYNGRVYNTPHPVEEYLEPLYGDWRVPVDWY